MTGFDGATNLPVSPVDADWLALREAADARSRDLVADDVLAPLLARWGDEPDRPLHVVDLGAGTGANLRWLAPRLLRAARQDWTLVDHDPRLRSWGPARHTVVQADVADLDRLMSEIGGADLVTASALLDVLDITQLSAVVGAVVAVRAPALFSLTVTGDVVVDPPDACDAPLAAAFDAHQRREDRPGPNAGTVVAALFRDRRWSVLQARTPWVLTCGEDSDLLWAWLTGRAEAAVDQLPTLAGDAAAWLARRRAHLGAGELQAVVGHVDLLAMPD